MLTLSNSRLAVHLLDPSCPGEYALQGSRFCWGGYVWQVEDASGGPLLSGPEFPAPQPDSFNGQGLPEAFRCRDRETGKPLTLLGDRGFVIGAGTVEKRPDGTLRLLEPAPWTVIEVPGALEFSCDQIFGSWHTRVERRVVLAGRTLSSCTRLHNFGSTEFPLHWFPHPFFPLTDGVFTAKLPAGYRIAENPAYAMDRGRLTLQNPFPPGDPGLFMPLLHTRAPLAVTLSHPKLPGIRMRCDYVPATVPVWANSCTFSIEPYLHTYVPAGGRREWRVHYEFLQ